MIVTYTKSGKTVRIEITDTHDWTDVVAWVMVKMGHTGTRTDDPVFDAVAARRREEQRKSAKKP